MILKESSEFESISSDDYYYYFKSVNDLGFFNFDLFFFSLNYKKLKYLIS